MNQQDILNLAKQGDAKAIAFLITQALHSFGVTAKGSTENDGLHLLLEGHQLPAREACIRVTVKGLERLQPNNVRFLTIYGRQQGQHLPAWTQKIDLQQPLTATTASCTHPPAENQQKVKSSIELISAAMLKNGQDIRLATDKIAAVEREKDTDYAAEKVAASTTILPVPETVVPPQVTGIPTVLPVPETAPQLTVETVTSPAPEIVNPPQPTVSKVILPAVEAAGVDRPIDETNYLLEPEVAASQPAISATEGLPVPKTRKQATPQQKNQQQQAKKPRLSIGTASLLLIPLGGFVLGSQMYKPSNKAARDAEVQSTPSPAPAPKAPAASKSPAPAAKTPVNLPATVSLKAVGDIIPGTNFPYNKLPENKERLFEDVKPQLKGADILFGNFESTLTDYPYSSKGAGGGRLFAFRTPPSYAKILKDAGFNILNVANNHSYDFNEQGFKDTIKHIDSNGMKAVGKRDQIVYKTVKGVRFAFIGFSNYGDVHNSLLEIEAGQKVVKKAKQNADIIVISVHAGAEGTGALNVRNRTEFFYGENRGNMVLFSRKMIDAGADLILGHGPHVTRALELYQGKLIAYSLGNFMGYRTLSTAAELGVSLILDVKMNPQGDFVSGKIIPVELNSRGIPFIDGDFRSVGLIRRLTKSDFPNTGLTIDDKGQILKKRK
ncbi:MAG: CapA family protein [Oscillatoriaceae cyanobacterium Prado104]|nr:CapA family protein [Oscillatoriaceae cyanobacterium Prado104]